MRPQAKRIATARRFPERIVGKDPGPDLKLRFDVLGPNLFLSGPGCVCFTYHPLCPGTSGGRGS